MKEVFQEYGGVIITIVAIVALVGVITSIIGTGEPGDTGIIYGVFQDLLNGFTEKVGFSPGTTQ